MNSISSFRFLRGQCCREVITALVFAGLLLQSATAVAPDWWSTRGVLNPQAQADDYAVANLGQLKHMAQKAAQEMNSVLPGGAGTAINAMITTWTAPAAAGVTRDDYAAVNLGQLKHVAKPFYDRLAAVGVRAAGSYPWTGINPDDYAVANLGQLKTVFAFLIALPGPALLRPLPVQPTSIFQIPTADFTAAALRWARLPALPAGASAADFDGDGISNEQEYRMSLADPVKYPLSKAMLDPDDWDGDGLANVFEQNAGLNPLNFADAMQDADADGLLNYDEIKLLAGSYSTDFCQPYSIRDAHLLPETAGDPMPVFVLSAACPLTDGQILRWRRDIERWDFTPVEMGGVTEPTTGEVVENIYPAPAPPEYHVWEDADANDLPDGYELWLTTLTADTNPNTAAGSDVDHDGMPNLWEHRYRLAFWDASNAGSSTERVIPPEAVVDGDLPFYSNLLHFRLAYWLSQHVLPQLYAKVDPDHDLLPNAAEHALGSNPLLASSGGGATYDSLLLDGALPAGAVTVLQFTAGTAVPAVTTLYTNQLIPYAVEAHVYLSGQSNAGQGNVQGVPVTFQVLTPEAGISGSQRDASLDTRVTVLTDAAGQARAWVMAPGTPGVVTGTVSCPLSTQTHAFSFNVTQYYPVSWMTRNTSTQAEQLGQAPYTETTDAAGKKVLSLVYPALAARRAWAGLNPETRSEGGGGGSTPPPPDQDIILNGRALSEEDAQMALEAAAATLKNVISTKGPTEEAVTWCWIYTDADGNNQTGGPVTSTQAQLAGQLPTDGTLISLTPDPQPWFWEVKGRPDPDAPPPQSGGTQVPDGHTYRERLWEQKVARKVIEQAAMAARTKDGELGLVSSACTAGPALSDDQWVKLKVDTRAVGGWTQITTTGSGSTPGRALKFPEAEALEIRLTRQHFLGTTKLTDKEKQLEFSRSFVIIRKENDQVVSAKAATLKLNAGQTVSNSGTGAGADGAIRLNAKPTADKAGSLKVEEFLLPIEIENPRGPIHELQISDSAPRVELDARTNSSVSVSGSQASVQISGKVFDPITALLPPGTADLTSLRIYVNGAKLSTTGNIQRQSTDQGLWKPYGDKFTISPFNVSFPARGTNLIRIETPPNAAGLIGKAEFEVNFRTEVTPRPPIPAFTVEQDIILSGALNPNAKDTVQLAAVGGAPSITLTETDNDTGVFASTQGHAFVMIKTFTATGSADRLPCSLMLPGSPMSFSLRGQSGQCIETGPQTMRFRYTETIPGRPQDSNRTEVLDNVQMHPIPKEQDGWFPLTLKMGSEIEGLKLKWFGKEFPIKSTSNGVCPTTKEGKPLVGIVVKRSQEPANPEQDPPPPVLEFMYYDHTASSIVRVPLNENQGKHEWKLMKGSQEVYSDELPLKQITFVNADGSRADGILPLPIETLQSILEGGTPQIDPEQYAFIELRGHIDGEVVRFGNEEAPFDFYDLIAGEAETLLQEGPRHVRLQKKADRKFRTTQKVVIYSVGDTSQQELTQSQWLALRDAGYLAIHNPDVKVFWGQEDIEWLTKERGSFHPPRGTKMGMPGATDPTKSAFYRFEGFEDHHLFNKFHPKWNSAINEWETNGKALAWQKLFGEAFDPDEFTVPVRTGVHKKTQHLANKAWTSFIDEVFDEATGELKPGITGKVLAQKRGEAFALMGELTKQMGLKLKWVRPYPRVLDTAYGGSLSLMRRLVNSKGRLGESLNRLGSLSSKFLKALGSTASEIGERLFKEHVKGFLKAGGKGVATCLPLVFAFQSHANAHQMLAHTMASGPKEGASVWLNLSMELEDLPLARSIVEQNWQMFADALAGASGQLCAQLPSGSVVKVGDPSFNCDFDGSGKIVHITPYVITNIWQFPDGRVKLRAKMTEDPYTSIEEEDAEWFITDWYPAIGETRDDWLEERRRAGALNDYGDP